MFQPQGLHAAAQRLGLVGSACCITLGQQADELFSAIARHQVVRARQPLAQHFSHRFQAGIALRVTVHIVVLLEVVQIDHHHRQWLVAAAAAAPLGLQGLIEMAAIGQVGECIHVSEFAQRFALRLLLGTVHKSDEDVVPKQQPTHGHGALRAVGSGDAKVVVGNVTLTRGARVGHGHFPGPRHLVAVSRIGVGTLGPFAQGGHVFFGVAKVLHKAPVAKVHAVLLIDHAQAHGHFIHQVAQQALGFLLLQRLLLGFGGVVDVAMPQHHAALQALGPGIATEPTLTTPGQQHTVIVLPQCELLHGLRNAGRHARMVVGVDAPQCVLSAGTQLLRAAAINFLRPLAGVGEKAVAIGVALVLVDQPRHVFCQVVQPLLQGVAFVDVGLRAHQAQCLALGVAFDGAATVVRPVVAAIGMAHAVGAFEQRAVAVDVALPGLQGGCQVVGVDALRPGLQRGGDGVVAVAQHFFPHGRVVGVARAHIHIPHALLGGLQHTLPARVQQGVFLRQCLLVGIRAAPAPLCGQQAQGGHGQRQQVKNHGLPHFGAQAQPQRLRLAPHPGHQGSTHQQSRWRNGAQGRQIGHSTRQHRAQLHAGHLAGCQVVCQSSFRCRYLQRHKHRPCAGKDKGLAIAVGQACQHVGRVAHGLQQRQEIFRIERGNHDAVKAPLHAVHTPRQHNHLRPQRALKRRTHHQCLRRRGRHGLGEILALAEIFAQQRSLVRGQHIALGIEHTERAHTQHRLGIGLQPGVQVRAQIAVTLAPGQLLRQGFQHLVDGRELAHHVVMHDGDLLLQVLAFAGIGAAVVAPQVCCQQQAQQQHDQRKPPPFTAQLRARGLQSVEHTALKVKMCSRRL